MIKKFLDLGIQPLANKYLTKKDIIKKNKEQFYHLEVGFDSNTKLVSIINTVPSKKNVRWQLSIQIFNVSDNDIIV